MGEEDDENQPPLADLSDLIRRRSPVTPQSDPWERFDSPPPTDTMWERLESRSPTTSESPSDGIPALQGRTPVSPLNSPKEVIVAHALFTTAALLVALAVFVAAFVRFIPERFWLLSLPIFAISVIGFVPVIAWKIGIWNPEQLD